MVKINRKLDKQSRLVEFVRQIKNPYLFKVGDVVVRIIYNDQGPTFEDVFKKLIETNIKE